MWLSKGSCLLNRKRIICIFSPTLLFFSLMTKAAKITLLSYYGGAKGQTLQIIETENGQITMNIIQSPENETNVETVTDVEEPSLPSKVEKTNYKDNIDNIHHTASNIIKMQEKEKEGGTLSTADRKFYEENIDLLNFSAHNLATMHEEQESDDYNSGTLTSWFERKKNNKLEKEKKRKGETDERKTEETEHEKEQADEGGEDPDDGVAVNLPPEDASVAEAKPVALAVAGVGGVAAAKPIATAVVGPGGLAIARPVGTAIAGVAPDQALVPIYAEGYVGVKPSKKNETSSSDQYLSRLIMKYHLH